jgi:pyruvate dehydrogenase E1 component alpha subunit
MLMAASWRLPIIWLCENNGVQAIVHFDEVWPVKDVADMAGSYGTPGVVIDGQDVIAVAEAVDAAVARARRGDGPTLIECKTLRFRPHAEGLPDSRSPEDLADLKRRDPIILFREELLSSGVLTGSLVERIDEEAAREMAEAERFALESPEPDPSSLHEGVFVG